MDSRCGNDSSILLTEVDNETIRGPKGVPWSIQLIAVLFGMGLAGMLAVIILALSPGPLIFEGAVEKMTADFQRSSIPGTFELERFGENFGKYLDSLNIPRRFEKAIRESREVIKFKMPEEGQSKWTMDIITDLGEHNIEFELDIPFLKAWSHSPLPLHHQCSRPNIDELLCTTNDTFRHWFFQTWFYFDKYGIVAHKANLNKGVTVKKFYRRVTEGHNSTSAGTGSNEKDIIEDPDESIAWEE